MLSHPTTKFYAHAIASRQHRDTKRKGPQPYDKGSLAGFPSPGPRNSAFIEETAHSRYVVGYLSSTGHVRKKSTGMQCAVKGRAKESTHGTDPNGKAVIALVVSYFHVRKKCPDCLES